MSTPVKVETDKAPGAIGPYSQALTNGKMIFVSGQLPVVPESGAIPETVPEQTAQSLANLKNILEAGGSSLSQVLKTTVFLANINDFAAVNEVYATFFSAPFPARSCFAVKDLPKGAKVEIEAVAII